MKIAVVNFNPIKIEDDKYAIDIVLRCDKYHTFNVRKNNEKELEFFMDEMKNGKQPNEARCKVCDKIIKLSNEN